MGSSVVWIWWAHPLGWGAFPGSNAYVWLSLVVLAALTRESSLPAPVLAHGIRAEADRS
jgi:alpha-1,2-mannosyltransferase